MTMSRLVDLGYQLRLSAAWLHITLGALKHPSLPADERRVNKPKAKLSGGKDQSLPGPWIIVIKRMPPDSPTQERSGSWPNSSHPCVLSFGYQDSRD